MLAANGAVTVLAVPLATMLGGPATALLGARPTLLACAVTILALGLVAATAAARPGPAARTTERTGPAGPHDPQTTGPHDQPGPHDPPARVDVPDRVRPGAT